MPNTASESSIVETFLPFISKTSNFAMMLSSFTPSRCRDANHAALGAGDCTFDSDEIVLGVNFDDFQVLDGDALGAQVAGQLFALEHTAGEEQAPMEPAWRDTGPCRGSRAGGGRSSV